MDFSALPKIDKLIEAAANDAPATSKGVLREAARAAVEALRTTPPVNAEALDKTQLFSLALADTLCRSRALLQLSPRPVINATGVVLHTNLGRAPLAKEAADAALGAAGYCDLEQNLDSGKRGSRYDHVKTRLTALFQAEDALVVNNNAAAVLLVLNALARGKEAVVSRGQLVEIGGNCRLPDIMEQSGVCLREVGTTNQTHLSDYQAALSERSGCLLQIHRSNFVMQGYVGEPSTAALAALAQDAGLPLVVDLGSGSLFPFAQQGIGNDPLPVQVLKEGADVVTLSGDKLLGGPQAGIILGRQEIMQKIAKDPLVRALRVDKMTLAALTATLRIYQEGREKTDVPTIAMLCAEEAELKAKAVRLLAQLSGLSAALAPGNSEVGGGSLPGVVLATWLVVLDLPEGRANTLLQKLASGDLPVIAYIHEDRVCLDMRTVAEAELPLLAAAVRAALEAMQ